MCLERLKSDHDDAYSSITKTFEEVYTIMREREAELKSELKECVREEGSRFVEIDKQAEE